MSVAWPGHFIPNSATFFPLSALCTCAGAKTLEISRFVMFSMFEHMNMKLLYSFFLAFVPLNDQRMLMGKIKHIEV